MYAANQVSDSCSEGRATGFPHDQAGGQDHPFRRQRGVVDPAADSLKGKLTKMALFLEDGGQTRDGIRGQFEIVKSNNRDILRHRETQVGGGPHRSQRQLIGVGEECGGGIG